LPTGPVQAERKRRKEAEKEGATEQVPERPGLRKIFQRRQFGQKEGEEKRRRKREQVSERG